MSSGVLPTPVIFRESRATLAVAAVWKKDTQQKKGPSSLTQKPVTCSREPAWCFVLSRVAALLKKDRVIFLYLVRFVCCCCCCCIQQPVCASFFSFSGFPFTPLRRSWLLSLLVWGKAFPKIFIYRAVSCIALHTEAAWQECSQLISATPLSAVARELCMQWRFWWRKGGR